MYSVQTMHLFSSQNNWSVSVLPQFDVIGPFPIHAREQHFISPSYPLHNLSLPIDFDKSWPSSYADGGSVKWSTTTIGDQGDLKVSFPDIRWDNLRNTEGWAALQHHALLRTTLTVHPPENVSSSDSEAREDLAYDQAAPPRLKVQLSQGSFFTIVPAVEGYDGPSVTPQWYPGNIYALPDGLPRYVDLPVPPSSTGPTKYDLFISGDYEIRLFGDPQAYNSSFPIQSLNLTIEIGEPAPEIVHEPDQDIVCDFVQGYAFGDIIGVGLRSASKDTWWTVEDVSVDGESPVSVALTRPVHLAPAQFRSIPLKLTQSGPLPTETSALNLSVTLTSSTSSSNQEKLTIPISIPLTHKPLWSESEYEPIKTSFLWMDWMPSACLVVPPVQSKEALEAPILALHGAGVEIFDSDFGPVWAHAIPRQKRRWIVLPSGGTSWGLDWHGPSTLNAINALDALGHILNNTQNPHTRPYLAEEAKFEPGTPFLLAGHSNGGQGAWWLSGRRPDRVLALVAASGYIKSQSYVPWTMSRSQRYMDPALQAILDTSLTPDNDDLFLSNLVNLPVLAVHGGADNNVPTWHSREAISVIKTWRPDADATMLEVPGENHWFDTVFNNDVVKAFLERLPSTKPSSTNKSGEFTVTVAIPSESGSVNGWKVESLVTAGRIGRLRVRYEDGLAHVKATNVKAVSVHTSYLPEDVHHLSIGGSQQISIQNNSGVVSLALDSDGQWRTVQSLQTSPVGRIQSILTSSRPLSIILPDDPTSHDLSVAQRLAHNLYLYYELDSQILKTGSLDKTGEEALGGAIVLGSVERSSMARKVLEAGKTPFKVQDGQLVLRDEKVLSEPGTGAIFLHPSTSSSSGLILFILAQDEPGLERALRLFPLRTGLPVPDFAITGPEADAMGSAGIRGAGVWGDGWSWDDRMSWLA